MSFNPGQKTSAKGKLLDCYRQRRREFIKSGVIAESSKRGSSSTSRVGSPRPSSGCSVQDAIDQLNEFTEDVDEKLLWLKNCCDPWVTVELNWDITAKKRLTDLTSSEITVEDYLREFKPLNQPGGVFLLLKDFKNLYQETDDKLYQNWPIVRPKIIKEVKKRSFNLDSELKDITTDIDDDDDEVLDLIGFMALPFLMTTSIIKKTNSKKRWRPSKHEALQGFICHVKAAAEIEETITRRKSKLQELGLTLQAFIIVVGPSLKKISARYIILNKLRYEIPSIIKTVDACFKIIFVLNAEYSAESTHIWQFIQKYVFKLNTKYDKIYTTVRTLATDLGLM